MRADLVGRAAIVGEVLAQCREHSGGVFLIGPAGVGKTRLVHELTDVLGRTGWWVERLVGSTATRTMPFGALVSLLPPDGGDRTTLLAGVRDRLRERAAGRRAVVSVDDAHLLDGASMACIVDLVHHTDAVVLLTLRSDDPVPIELTALWSAGRAVRLDVEPLSDADTLALAEAYLDGPVTPELGHRLVELAAGLPLLLRELLLDARATGGLREVDGVWHEVRPFRSGPRMQELVAARVRHLEPAVTRLLETVAVGEPLSVGTMSADEAAALDSLEQQGLARLERVGDRWTARADHPLIGDALRARMSTRRRVEVLRDLVERTRRTGCDGRGDALRVARWSAEVGDDPPVELALSAGREALAALDLDLAVQLAKRALEHEPCDALLLLGELRRLEGRPDEADEALAGAASLAVDDDRIVRIAMLRSALLAHHSGRPGPAIALLEDAAGAVQDPARALELESEASYLSGLLGRFGDVIRTSRRILARSTLDADTAWTARINLIYAQTMLGRLEGVDAHLDVARVVAHERQQGRPEAVDLLWALLTGVAVQRGELVAIEGEIAAHIERCRHEGGLHGLTTTIFLQALLYRGSPMLLPMAAHALAELDAADPFAVRPIALASAALARVSVGDVAGARCALDEIPAGLEDVRAGAFVGRAHAAVVATEKPLPGACIAAASGTASIDSNHISFGVLALYDAALLGRPDLVVDELREVVTGSDAPLLVAMRDHAAALHAEDPHMLEQVAERLARMGARPLAAAAYGHAAASHQPGSATARRSAARSALWAMAGGSATGRTVEIDGGVTARELEIAAHAADGLTSRQIGQSLFLSVRTVDNHLRQVYAKLEVADRVELREVLAPRPDRVEATSMRSSDG